MLQSIHPRTRPSPGLQPWVLFCALLTLIHAALAQPITILGPTSTTQPLPPLPNVRNIVVHRPRAGDWTYNHHPDMAEWKSRLYVAWDACEKDEDVGPSRELYATSADGITWSKPQLLFPQGQSTALRMYFYHASNDRMLAISGLRTSKDTTAEASKGGLLVREIHSDHTLGDVFLLRPANDAHDSATLPLYTSSKDDPFIQSCNELLHNKPFLEQQDYGLLLNPADRMKWHDIANWPADEPSRVDFNRFGKAICFFHRADNTLVGIMKWGWVITSGDSGQTWSAPVRPPTLITGMAKVWAQRTSNNKYILVYNPDREKRYPLVMVTGADGITFGNMQIVNADHPDIRFPGLHKVPGPQYPRGVSEFSSDHSRKDNQIFIAYSMGKEDIYVSIIPNP